MSGTDRALGGREDAPPPVEDEFVGLRHRARFCGPGRRRVPRRCLLEYDPDSETLAIRSPDLATTYLVTPMAEVQEASRSGVRSLIRFTVGGTAYHLHLGGSGFPPDAARRTSAAKMFGAAMDHRRRSAVRPLSLYAQWVRLFREYVPCR